MELDRFYSLIKNILNPYSRFNLAVIHLYTLFEPCSTLCKSVHRFICSILVLRIISNFFKCENSPQKMTFRLCPLQLPLCTSATAHYNHHFASYYFLTYISYIRLSIFYLMGCLKCKKAVQKVMSNIFLHAKWEQQTKESAVVDGTSCNVILECLVTSIACIT